MNLKITPNTTESGKYISNIKYSLFITGLLEKTSDKVREDKSGLMDLCMRDGGKITKLMVKEDLSMLMEMFMMGNGLTIKLMALGSTVI